MAIRTIRSPILPVSSCRSTRRRAVSRSDDSIGGPVGDHVAALTPYARSLGIAVDRYEDGVPVITVPFASGVEGRPGHFHGGATSGVLETAGYAALRCALTERGVQPQLKPINITVQFLAAAKNETVFAMARINKLGRRNANLTVEAWQSDRSRPVATAVMNILMV
ncbi:MAG: PaaI family thioesterase [Sphingomonadaceae bacterium]|nr:PaaI family thioesterase [Sphingomonadaceae bacterium]MCP5384650.1 PaaI family thioesterase [Altererythrobacter sp.]MCP5391729.1 PaaI family thioesterase [Sphingomonadaceae bacterium]MCP5393843.1 PaaI family thioesterase [Sphingomonadaceae bacterium]